MKWGFELHYVLKNKFKEGLVASADELMDEFYRAQKQLLSIDQNNIGDATHAGIPGSPVPILTGITQTAFAAPSSGESPIAHKSLTRWHFDSSAVAGTSIDNTDEWTDQIGYADISFRSYRAAPYLLLAFAQLTQDRTLPSGNPLKATISIRLDGEIIEPGHHVSYGHTTTAGPALIAAPAMFVTSRMLFPGDHRAIVSIKQDPGKTALVLRPAIAAIGFVR